MSVSDMLMEDNLSTVSLRDFEDEHEYEHYIDNYSENEVFDNEDDNNSQDTHESYVMIGKKNKKIKKKKVKHDKQDKGLRKIKTKEGENLVYFATSMLPGNSVRDAVYGTYIHEDKVGSINEDLYFKVAYADNGSKQNVDKLFYDNPEQFENHMKTTVPTYIKQDWADTYRYALKRKQKVDETQFVSNIKIK
tara:strand:- start:9559 stop:10134 length:576 start_codon:yes stop_codon:yes gene_type:complete